MVASPDGHHAYVTNDVGEHAGRDGSVSLIDTDAGTVAATSYINGNPPIFGSAGVVSSPDGRRIYVVRPDSYGISVIDAATLDTITDISSGHKGLLQKLFPQD